jgi:chromosome segregation ATPase
MSYSHCEKCGLQVVKNLRHPCCFYKAVLEKSFEGVADKFFEKHELNTNNLVNLYQEVVTDNDENKKQLLDLADKSKNLEEEVIRLKTRIEELEKKENTTAEQLKKTSNQARQFMKMFKTFILGFEGIDTNGLDIEQVFEDYSKNNLGADNINKAIETSYRRIKKKFNEEEKTRKITNNNMEIE